jgi:Universal stress protein family
VLASKPSEIEDAANNRHCDLIVMASHGRHGISAIVQEREEFMAIYITQGRYTRNFKNIDNES